MLTDLTLWIQPGVREEVVAMAMEVLTPSFRIRRTDIGDELESAGTGERLTVVLGHVRSPAEAGLPPEAPRPILVDVAPDVDDVAEVGGWYRRIPLRRLRPALPLIAAGAVAEGAFEELRFLVRISEAYRGCRELRDVVLTLLDTTRTPITSVKSLAGIMGRERGWFGDCWRRCLSPTRDAALRPK